MIDRIIGLAKTRPGYECTEFVTEYMGMYGNSMCSPKMDLPPFRKNAFFRRDDLDIIDCKPRVSPRTDEWSEDEASEPFSTHHVVA